MWGNAPVSRFGLRALMAEAVAGLLQRPVRSLLTMLGTVLGIGSFVAILGLSATASGQIGAEFSLLEATQVSVRENTDRGGQSMPFTADATERMNAIDGVIDSGVWWKIEREGAGRPTLTTGVRGSTTSEPDMFAASPGALKAAEIVILEGRSFDTFAEDARTPVVMLSQVAATQLGITNVAMAPAVFIGEAPFTVVGIFSDTRRLPQLLSGIVIPTTTALDFFGPPESKPGASLLARTRVGAAGTVAGQAPIALRPDAPKVLVGLAAAAPASLRAAVTGSVDSLILVLASVTLVIGAVGIANTTLVAVVERTSEIGLRRALGATPSHISRQFLAEAALLGALGGIVGTSLALATVLTVSLINDWTPLIAPITVYVAPVAGAVVGILAGAYPALRASRIAPVTALQH